MNILLIVRDFVVRSAFAAAVLLSTGAFFVNGLRDAAAQTQPGAPKADPANGKVVKTLKLPTAGFSLAGLGLGTLSVGGFGVPAAQLASRRPPIPSCGGVRGTVFPSGSAAMPTSMVSSALTANAPPRPA